MAKKVQYIKISRVDQDGKDNSTTLESLNQITIPFTNSGNKNYKISSRARFNDYYLFIVDLPISPDASANPTNNTSTTLNYEFTGSTANNTVLGPPYGSQYPILAPISSSSGGQVNPLFYNAISQRLEFNTLPLKNITVSTNTIEVNVANASAEIELYKLNSTLTSYVKLTTSANISVGTEAITRTATILKADISPGDIIGLGIRRTTSGGGNGPTVTLTTSTGVPIRLEMSSTVATGDTLETIPEPYLTKAFQNSDCDVLINNANEYRENPFLQDVDYGNGILPVNNAAIVAGTALKGTVPESNYTFNNVLNPGYNSLNETSKYNVDASSFSSQTSAGCFVAYWKTLTSVETVPDQKYYAVASLKYLITPNGELLEINSEPEMVGLIGQLFGVNANSISANSGTANFFGEPNISRNTSISFSNTGSTSLGTLLTSDSEASNYTGFGYVVPFAGTVNLLLYTSSSFAPTPLGTDSDGGLVFPTDINLTTQATLPARARQILTENNVIPPQQ
mgnify:CR=1 FL=1|tara:strand:+ start:3408 stop:4940 length:1533 start_codon:yes stop_codon:yes gene_type:complete